MVSITATVGKHDGQIKIEPKDIDGNDATVQPGSFTATIESGDGSVSVESDTQLRIVTGPTVGRITGKLKADADLGEGENSIEEDFEIDVIAAPIPQANNIGATGTAVDKIVA